MISAVDEAVSRLLQNELGLKPGQIIDEPPGTFQNEGEITLSLYLFDMSENVDLKEGQRVIERPARDPKSGEVGKAVVRIPPVFFNLDYVVSPLSGVRRDIHNLLLDIELVMMRHAQLPPDLINNEVREQLAGPLRVSLVNGETDPLEFWQAFGLPPRPALFYRVILPVPIELAYEARIVRARKFRLYQRNP